MLDRLKGVELIGPEIAPPDRRQHTVVAMATPPIQITTASTCSARMAMASFMMVPYSVRTVTPEPDRIF